MGGLQSGLEEAQIFVFVKRVWFLVAPKDRTREMKEDEQVWVLKETLQKNNNISHAILRNTKKNKQIRLIRGKEMESNT